VTEKGNEIVCNNHHFVLREIQAVRRERKIGEEKWNEVPDFMNQNFNDDYSDDLGDWKELIDYKANKRDK